MRGIQRGALAAIAAACAATTLAAAPAVAKRGDVPTFGYDVNGSRYAAAERAIKPRNVHKLKLAWSFVIPVVS